MIAMKYTKLEKKEEYKPLDDLLTSNQGRETYRRRETTSQRNVSENIEASVELVAHGLNQEEDKAIGGAETTNAENEGVLPEVDDDDLKTENHDPEVNDGDQDMADVSGLNPQHQHDKNWLIKDA